MDEHVENALRFRRSGPLTVKGGEETGERWMLRFKLPSNWKYTDVGHGTFSCQLMDRLDPESTVPLEPSLRLETLWLGCLILVFPRTEPSRRS